LNAGIFLNGLGGPEHNMILKNKSASKNGKQHIEIACEDGGVLDYKSLKPFQGNLKTLMKEDYERLKAMILKYGFTAPIHVWKSKDGLYTIDGHQRCRALECMEKEGYQIPPVPVVMVKAKSHEDAKRILLAHTSQYGKMESQGLYEFISEAKISYDELVQSTKFDIVDFMSFKAEYFEDKNGTGGGSGGGGDTVPDVPKNVHNVKRGQVWKLGEHRLMCGDSTSNEDVKKLMAGEKVDITFTSPPYNAGCFGFQDGKDKYGKKADDKTQLEYFKFLVTFTDIALEVSSYVFFNNQFLSGNIEALAKFIGHYAPYLKDVFPWIKNTAPPNVNPGVFTNRFEVILCLEKDKKKKGFPVAWQGKYHNVIDGSTAAKDNVAADSHSATMPLYVPDFFLERLPFVKSIYEPFGGTGTTLIAAEVRQAKCFAMEMDEHYCSVIIERWQQFTSMKAELT